MFPPRETSAFLPVPVWLLCIHIEIIIATIIIILFIYLQPFCTMLAM